MKIDVNQIKIGNILEIKNKLWKVNKTQHTQPGKGGAFLQVELKEVKSGTKINERFRSSDTVEKIILDEKDFQYLYKSENNFVFMDTQSFEQIELSENIINANQALFLVENDIIKILMNESDPVSVVLPESIILKVEETEAVTKGQTATSSFKKATLEKNIKTSVPQFIEIGDIVVINTNDGSYIEKAKKK